MQNVTQYRGTHRLVTSEVEKIAIQILREIPEAGDHELAALERMAETFSEAGLGDGKGDPAGEGYWQILALLSAMLLRIGGANVDAAANAVTGQSAAALEKLTEAVVGRMRLSHGSKAAVKRLRVDSSAESAIRVEKERLVNTSNPGMLSPFAADAGPNNPAVAYLREHTDDDLRRQVRNLVIVPGPERPAVSPSTPIHGIPDDVGRANVLDSGAVTVAVDSTPLPTAPVTLEIAEGVQLTMTLSALASHQPASKRAELIRALASAINSHYADEG